MQMHLLPLYYTTPVLSVLVHTTKLAQSCAVGTVAANTKQLCDTDSAGLRHATDMRINIVRRHSRLSCYSYSTL